jgi:TPR repeat protein
MHGCFNLGIIYQSGQGATRNEVEAMALYDRACDAGLAPACFNEATLMTDRSSIITLLHRALKIDPGFAAARTGLVKLGVKP